MLNIKHSLIDVLMINEKKLGVCFVKTIQLIKRVNDRLKNKIIITECRVIEINKDVKTNE